MVAYKAGDNFSILRCHGFMMRPPIREVLGLPEFDVRGLYRAVETFGKKKLFSSMKSDIGIRPIRTWTDDAVDGILLICSLAQAMTSVTRFLCEPASSTATKFITDAMQKLTLTVVRRKGGERRFVLSDFTPLNEAVLRCYGLFSEVPTV